ncbi:MAG: hydrogenase maturation protease [Methylococcales bacterium]|nr:hydrogenase maturation protease [Methylococcales bacterium]
MVKPVLVFGYGNLSRGDDALGPLLLAHIEAHCDLERVELLVDFQLQIEHALDIQQRELVLFADASLNCPPPFAFTAISPAQDNSYTTHAMSPAALLAVYQRISPLPLPPCFLLSIHAEKFGLGDGLSPTAASNLVLAGQFVETLLAKASVEDWCCAAKVG